MEDHGEEAENHPAVLAEHVGARLQCDAPLHCESAQAGIPHTHGFAQLLLVLSGQGVFEVDGRALRMRTALPDAPWRSTAPGYWAGPDAPGGVRSFSRSAKAS